MPSRLFLSTAGLVLSLYAVFVEYKMESKPEEEVFTALCDIDAIGASCSTVFTLPVGRLLSYFGVVPHGHVLDIPNAALGVIYYTWHILLSDVSQLLTSAMTILAFLSTVFLAYQLTFILHELCILCWSTHVINTWLMYKMVHSSNRSDKTKSS
jgi:vitamin-K-epoxide reductase (warfarin-sensitive)